ncbi:OTU domain-containing protein 5 isoform X2 [Abrus precatorius]|uniref:OTU domain-containing protein 5 isoform X2 n=1 Tax=Abrus precatorius TaxID=3816 RepID=A0A8B8KMA6_ABRPR|nr:OTU domain-containing protein 5 isoform X2 [Abrus precatorius]
MTRVLVQRGSSGGSSSNASRSSAASSSSSSARVEVQSGEEVVGDEVLESGDKGKCEDVFEQSDDEMAAVVENDVREEIVRGLSGIRASSEIEGSSVDPSLVPASGGSCPPPPPVPPPKPAGANLNSRRSVSGSSNFNSGSVGSSRRGSAWPVVSARTSPAGSRPSSPRSLNESEGYNSADEQKPCFVSSYDDFERERQFEIDIRRAKGYEVKKMTEDGNCLFRAVADQVYGDSDAYDVVRQMCIDYMERERDHFSQFITEGFMSYCKRKRRDKVYGNNVEIQAICEMYNRPIHIYSYSTEPINSFHGSYTTDTPPIRLSYHHGNHYNSLVDPRRLTIGAGLGFSCLRGTNVDTDQVKAAIKAQQDQQINNALLAEGRFYSDLELTEKEIERMVMEVSRAEYLADGDSAFKQQLGDRESSTSNAEPSSSGARSSGTDGNMEHGKEHGADLSSGMRMLLSMGFSYIQAVEAYSIFGDDVDSMVCYLLDSGSSSRLKGKATE